MFICFRIQDLKDERRRSQLSASRTILEKSTMLILTSSKVGVIRRCWFPSNRQSCYFFFEAYLRHLDCVYSRQCRDLVYDQVRRALDMVKFIVYDSGSTASNNNPTLTLLLTKDEINFIKSLRQFEVNSLKFALPAHVFRFSMPLKCSMFPRLHRAKNNWNNYAIKPSIIVKISPIQFTLVLNNENKCLTSIENYKNNWRKSFK